MKNFKLLLLVAFVSIGLNVNAQQAAKKAKKQTTLNSNDYVSFGDKFELNKVITKEQMFKKYKSLKKGDSIAVKFVTKINSVCKKKGCWMKLDLGNGESAFVKFKDYGFFVPLNADGSLKEIFGAGTAAVVSPIVAFAYQGTEYQLPQIENSFALQLKEDLTKIQYKLAEDTFGWTVKI